MRPPRTPSGGSSMKLAGWASRWQDREEGWPHRISVLAGHSPREIDYIRQTRTYSDVAEHWKDFRAADPDYAYDDLSDLRR